MDKERCIVLSPYFSNNTLLVAGVCSKCYIRTRGVLIKAVNVCFLRNHDLEQCSTFLKSLIEKEHSEDDYVKLNCSKELSFYKSYWLRDSLRGLRGCDTENNNNNEQVLGGTKEKNTKYLGTHEFSTDESNKGKWIPPISPHNLIEERYYHDPWALLVVTIFLNRTSCYLALPFIESFFDHFKGPYDVMKKEVEHLEPYFERLGLTKTRANQLWRMSHDFVTKDWREVKELYGVGKYAEDAYRMFHLGDFSVQPKDRYLKIYKAWYEMMVGEDEWVCKSNSQVYLEDYHVEHYVGEGEGNGDV